MHQKIFINAGLTKTQAQILSYLLENGENKARDIAGQTKIPRGVVYKGLEELSNLGLVEQKIEKSGITRFRAEHPAKLEQIFDEKEKEIKRQRRVFNETLPELASIYNLSLNKPGIRFYEGSEGIKKTLFDSLKSKTEIYTYADIKAVKENLAEINSEYARRREKQGIKKRIITADTKENRQFFAVYNREITLVKFLRQEYYPFKTGMQIYDNKISYQTLSADNMIGVIIENKNIYHMHKLFFEYTWDSLPNN